MAEKFMFFENFLQAVDCFPENERYKICYDLCRYGLTGELPDDPFSKGMCMLASESMNKFEGRGGYRSGSGRKQKINQNEIKNNQNEIKNNQNAFEKNQNSFEKNQNNQNSFKKNQNNQNNQKERKEKENTPQTPEEKNKINKIYTPSDTGVSVSPMGDATKETEPKKDIKRGCRWEKSAYYAIRIPDAFTAEAGKLCVPPDIAQREYDKFGDYWVAKSGQNATKLDWLATWRNWLRSAGLGKAKSIPPDEPDDPDDGYLSPGERAVAKIHRIMAQARAKEANHEFAN